MATDWPGHAAFNRHFTLPPSPGPKLWFTPNNNPPFAYRLEASDPSNPIWWVWTQFTHYIGTQPSDLIARWIRSNTDPLDVELWTLELFTQGFPATVFARLRADHFTPIQVSTAENILSLGEPEGWEMPRGTVLVFETYGWSEVTNFPLDEGVPDVTITAYPVDCIPNWRPPQHLP